MNKIARVALWLFIFILKCKMHKYYFRQNKLIKHLVLENRKQLSFKGYFR